MYKLTYTANPGGAYCYAVTDPETGETLRFHVLTDALATLRDLDPRAARRATADRLAALGSCYRDTVELTPAETLETLAGRLGDMELAQLAVAEAVNGVGSWDARVWDYVRSWARHFPGAITPEDMQDAGLYAPGEIHPAHINQLGQAAMKAGLEGWEVMS